MIITSHEYIGNADKKLNVLLFVYSVANLIEYSEFLDLLDS